MYKLSREANFVSFLAEAVLGQKSVESSGGADPASVSPETAEDPDEKQADTKFYSQVFYSPPINTWPQRWPHPPDHLTPPSVLKTEYLLRDTLKLAPSTISMYISGIEYQYRLMSIPSPPLFSIPVIYLILRGIKRSLPPSAPIRQTMPSDILSKLICTLRNSCFTPSDDLTMETVCLTAFFSFLRCSDVPSADSFPAIGLHRSDLSLVSDSHFVLVIRASKTDQLRQD
ncbi:UNVERIFIED_CONTAM: hypothetical protein FKN15_019528 [Acipenser sinensis]